MTTTNQEVYDAFIEAGVSPEKARAAAASVASQSDVATKRDLAELEARIYRSQWIQGFAIITIMSGIFSIFAGKG